MTASPSSVLTMGLGSWSDPARLVTLGWGRRVLVRTFPGLVTATLGLVGAVTNSTLVTAGGVTSSIGAVGNTGAVSGAGAVSGNVSAGGMVTGTVETGA